VRVRVEACGLGAADFGFFQLDALPRTPLVPGLEAVGIVEVSSNARFPVGARVGMTPLSDWCGGCDACERGLERFCAQARLHGWHRDGFLSDHVVTTERAVLRLDGDVDPVSWAPLFASGWTALSAVRATGIGRGLRLGVFGLGGVGHLAAQIARALGLETVGIDIDPSRLEATQGPDDATGAAPSTSNEPRPTTDAATDDLARAASPPPVLPKRPWTSNEARGATRGVAAESLDAAVVFTPSPQAIAQAIRGVRRGGRVVLAGASPSVRLDVSLIDAVMRGISLVPAFLGTRSELDELINLVRAGTVQPITRRLSLSEVPKQFWLLRDGGFTGRLVVTPDR
jgi:propanol-preferring alcohol dehydrogenase